MISRLAAIMTKEGILKGDIIDKEKDKMHKESIRLEKWTAKVMHGQYRRQIITIADLSSWEWLKRQDLNDNRQNYPPVGIFTHWWVLLRMLSL